MFLIPKMIPYNVFLDENATYTPCIFTLKHYRAAVISDLTFATFDCIVDLYKLVWLEAKVSARLVAEPPLPF